MHADHENQLEEDWIDEEDDDDDPAHDLLQCPACRAAVHEDTQQCPYCGDWITPVHPRSTAARWAVTAVVLLMIASLIMLTVL